MGMHKQVKSDIDFYIRTKAGGLSWRKQSQKWYEFAIMNKQWSTEEEEELKRRGQAPLVINRLKPVVRLYQSFLGARAPRIRSIPVRSDIGSLSAEKISRVFNALFNWIWYSSDGDAVVDSVIENFLVRALGYFFVRYDKFGRDGVGSIVIEDLHPDDVFVDMDSRKKDFQDASRIVVSKEISLEEAYNRMPEHKRRIKKSIDKYVTQDNVVTTDLYAEDGINYGEYIYDNETDKVRIFDVYAKITVPMYDVVNTATGQWNQLSEDEFEELDLSVIKYTHKKVYTTRIKRRFHVGDVNIGEEVLPTSYYPVIPVIYQHLGNTFPLSLIHYGRDIQKEINKRRSLMIAHATANASGTKVIYESGAVTDKEQVETDFARPSGWTEVNDINLIKEIQASPLPTSLVQLEQFAKSDTEYVLGAPASSMGIKEGSNIHDTFKGVLALDEFAHRNMAPASKALYLSLKRVGKVVVDYIQEYMSTPQMIRIVQPYDNPTEEMQELMLNMPIYDEKTGVINGIENDVTVGKYDIEVVANSTNAESQAALEEKMLLYYEAGLIDDIEVYKHIKIFDKQGLIARKSLLTQQQQQIQDMQNSIESLISEAESLAMQLKDETFNHEVTKFKKHMNDVKLRAARGQMDLDNQIKRAIDELRLEQKRERSTRPVSSGTKRKV